jgi:hypothetical protein
MNEEEEESFGSYDWGELENGSAQAVGMSEQDARGIAMRLTNQIVSWRCSQDDRRGGGASNRALFTAVVLHMIRRLKQPRTQSTDVLNQQAVRTWASVAVTFLRSGQQKWNELPLMQQFDDRKTNITFLCSLLATLKHDVSLGMHAKHSSHVLTRVYSRAMWLLELLHAAWSH